MDVRIPLKFIMPGQHDELYVMHSAPWTDNTRLTPIYSEKLCKLEMVHLRPTNSSHTVVTDAGHLITQEKPKELGEHFAA